MSLQYNGEANGQDICTLADKMAKSDSLSFPIAEKTIYANMGMREIWKAIFLSYGGWIYDDSNLTDLPVATTDLVKDQKYYALPVTAMSHLISVEFKNVGGTWIPLTPLTIEKINQQGYADSEFLKYSAVPMFYRPVATGIQLYPPANWDASASLRIHISRDISAFVVTDTTKVPGFDPLFHEGLPIYMALKYAQANSLPQAGGTMRGGYKTGLLSDWYDFIDGLKRHYQERFKQMFPPRIKVRDATREFM